MLVAILFFICFSGICAGQIPSIQEKQQKGKPALPELRRELPPPNVSLRAAPPGPVNSVAEWEESDGVMSLWWNYDLMDKLQENGKVYIPVDNQSEKESWITYLTDNGVPLTNIEFWFIPTNSIYTRDYGPWFIWDANNELGVVNYTCDYGYYDDLFPQNFCDLFNIDYYESSLNHVGGNWYPNAYKIAFSTTMAYWSNWTLTSEEVDQVMLDYYGIEKYNTCAVAPWTIEHHDCWGKPANPETMIIADFPDTSYYHPYTDAENEHYETLESPWGRPYKIFRLPMCKMGSEPKYGWRPFMNSLVSNKKVFFGITNHPDDQIARDVYEEAFPGYEIVGVDHKGTNWNDSVHCRTRNLVKADAIRMYPLPPGDTEDTVNGYPVTIEVIPPNGSSLVAGYPVIHWTDTGAAPFNDVVMTATGQPNEYEGLIPAQALGTEVSFYIEAQDDGGHNAIYPLVAPDGMMSFNVRLDEEAPVLSRFIPTRSASSNQWPPSIRTLCKDDMATPEVRIEWKLNNAPQADLVLDREHMCYWYSGIFDGSANPGDVVSYRVVASDEAATTNTSILPLYGEIYCPVTETVPVGIVEMSTRPYTGPFLRETLNGLDIPFHYYRSWPSDWSAHDVWFVSLGTTPDNHVLSHAEALDLTGALQNGAYIYMESSDAWCWDDEKTTIDPWFGVQEQGDGGNLHGDIIGQNGTLMSGITLVYAGESAYNDQIGALSGAEVIFECDLENEGRTVLYDAPSGYKSIASGFALGGLLDGVWPDTRKSILLQILDFFELLDHNLVVRGEAELGTNLPISLQGTHGDAYALLGSIGENYLPCNLGLCRIDLTFMIILQTGEIPPSGMIEYSLPIPREETFLNLELHFQAILGEQIFPLVNAGLTNREIVKIKRAGLSVSHH